MSTKELSTNELHLAAAYRIARAQNLPDLDHIELAMRTGARHHLPALARIADGYTACLWGEADRAINAELPQPEQVPPAAIGMMCVRYTTASSALAYAVRRRAQGNRPHGPRDEVWNILVAALAVAYRRHAATGDLATLAAMVDDVAASIGAI